MGIITVYKPDFDNIDFVFSRITKNYNITFDIWNISNEHMFTKYLLTFFIYYLIYKKFDFFWPIYGHENFLFISGFFRKSS